MSQAGTLLVASGTEIWTVDPLAGTVTAGSGLGGARPASLAVDPHRAERAWLGTIRGGVFRTDDRGRSWRACGMRQREITALVVDPVRPEVIWVGTEPSALWVSEDEGRNWEQRKGLEALPSSPEWSFPPKPETHHVRWILPDPKQHGRLWLAIEAGALIRTEDGGGRWMDRVPGGPRDSHELAVHPVRPEILHSAAGDGYFESRDGGRSWTRLMKGLEIGYFRSVAIDPGNPETVLISGASKARSSYVTGRSDGRVYRREGEGGWLRVQAGWPEPPNTIAPLLRSGQQSGEFWTADERGVHRSDDGGRSWVMVVGHPSIPHNLRGFGVLG